ncbi:PVC-type heme-binding CxxCH protein [Stieleria maiorica]|uniref:PVC-type heme-binding CxxCH protein n=1 Tax=Stieleria maiorica TaxID=2795974 RepID=UPI00142F2B33|nr:PVC-type heme-binding CxxCH protein [Stieleria maiorica]
MPIRSTGFVALFLVIAAINVGIRVDAAEPVLTDDRLQLTLFAEDPEIMTPIGMAIDDRDRVFVIESHTHNPPSGYTGPDSDRIKIFVDRDDDGRADTVSVFADGIHQAMNLAFSPDGELYVVCAREVLRLVDEDRDGVCDRKDRVLQLVTEQRYAHNSLLSITFDRDGWMYVGRGNTGSDAYRLVGRDDSYVAGYGDGGNVIRCRPDGTRLSEFATGFWNPFDLKFDAHGRLLLVDNDPDARGPNRLLQVVRGGDYGYKSMFGGAGTHPFQGWDGTLPGTLPYIAGTGEAPSGLIDCRRSALPKDYQHSVLATIWNENSIERFELDPDSATLTGKSVFLSGDQDFRPVALDCDRHGNLFLTDWVLVDYPNHGRGRIWRVTVKPGTESIQPRDSFADYQLSDQQKQIGKVESMEGAAIVEQLSLGNFADPIVRHAAVMRLSAEGMSDAREACLGGDASLRMVGLLASKRANLKNTTLIRRLLADPAPEIRQAALMWAGESMELSLAADISSALRVQPVTPVVLETYLAATELLTPEFIRAYNDPAPGKANKLPRSLDRNVIVRLAKDTSLAAEVRSLAISRFDSQLGHDQLQTLVGFLQGNSDPLRIAAMDVMAQLGIADQSKDELIALAKDPHCSVAVRTHALAAIGSVQGLDSETLNALTQDTSPQVATQARRTLRAFQPTVADNPERPRSRDDWHAALAGGGDALLGRHVFHSPRVGCVKCHWTNGRGETLGPGLAGVARSKTRSQIIDAILAPSAEFPPQYQAWMVLADDGVVHRGLQLDHKAGGAIVLTTENGDNRYFKGEEVEAYQALPTSLMPDGLEQLMSVDELRDLIAYLMTLDA